MNRNLPDRSLIREYLLGRLDTKEELERQLSQDIVFNEEVAEMVESIEEEIIEDFLDGTLDSADKDAVSRYFLRPPERREKLRFAKLLRHHFEEQHELVGARSDALPSPYINVMRDSSDYSAPIPRRSYFRAYGQLAALVLLSVGSLIYIYSFRKDQARLEGQLAQEREHSASLVKEAQLLPSAMVPLTLVSDRFRGDHTQIPQIEIKPSTQRIIVDIALQGHNPGPFDVHLETTGGKRSTWSARLLPIVDVYSFVVSSPLPGSGGANHYDFHVKVTH